jgi:hypothetical protein
MIHTAHRCVWYLQRKMLCKATSITFFKCRQNCFEHLIVKITIMFDNVCRLWYNKPCIKLRGTLKIKSTQYYSAFYNSQHYGLNNTIKHIKCRNFFSVPVCAITASGVPGGTLVSMNCFSTLGGWLAQRQGWKVKVRIWPGEQARSANSQLDYQRPLEK